MLYTQDHIDIIPADNQIKAGDWRNAISHAAVNLAKELDVDAIVAETKTGATAANVAAFRPNIPIISVTSEKRSAQQLALSYANRSFIRPDGERAGVQLAKELFDNGMFGDADNITVAVISGRQPGVSGETDTIRVRSFSR